MTATGKRDAYGQGQGDVRVLGDAVRRASIVRGLELMVGCRVPKGRVIFEIGGSPIREELARDGALPVDTRMFS